MKRNNILKWSVLLALALVALTATGALAASPTSGNSMDNPYSLANVSGTSQTLAPGATVWYSVTYAAGTQAEIDLSTNGVGGVTFAVYTPDQASALVSSGSSTPVGAGTYNQWESNYDLTWVGHPAETDGSTYYVVVTNNNSTPTPTQLILTVSGM